MPTIFHLDDAMSWRGGEQQVAYLHDGLLQRGWDSVVVCAPGSALEQRLAERAQPHEALPLRGAHDLRAAWRLGDWVRSRGGILHTHTSHAHDLGLWASRLRGRFPLVVSRRVDFPVGAGPLGRWKYRNGRVHRYYAISSAVERELLAAGIEAERIRRVPSGIDLTRFEAVQAALEWRAELGLPDGEPLFGNVAALAPHKDQTTLLRAFAAYAASGGKGKLVVLGEGELRPRLEKLRAELGMEERVLLPGFEAEILPRIRALDVFVMSSELEGLGTSILDAMALGRCIVATRTGGIPDAVRDGDNGLLVPPRDPEQLAAALRRVAEDAALRDRLGRAAARDVLEFSVERTVELSEAGYEELLRELDP